MRNYLKMALEAVYLRGKMILPNPVKSQQENYEVKGKAKIAKKQASDDKRR